jgi:hypothetical protein
MCPGIFDLCDRIFARIRIEHVTKETNEAEWERKKNQERADLKIAVVECLTALLEGVQDDLIPRQMLVLLNWVGVVDQMKTCFASFERGTDLGKSDGRCMREAMLYFFLLKNVKNYDKTNQYVLPELAGIPHRMLRYLEDRTGYIEIVRNGYLERCFFQLPEACVPGGELSRKSFDEMYETEEREEFDGKTSDFLENMVNIVEKVQFHHMIRQSAFAFTVKHWDVIRHINFFWTLLLHLLLIFGGYMPLAFTEHYQERVDEAYIAFAEDDETRRKAKSTSGQSGDRIEFNLTKTDVYFFEEVQPIVVQVARWMNWINLVTCGLRLFAFAWSEMPIVIRRALRDLEDEDEGNADEAGFSFPEKTDEDEVEVSSVFVEHFVPVDAQADHEHEEAPGPTEPQHSSISGWWKILLVTICSPKIEYEFMFTVFPLLAIIYDEPLFAVYALFEICIWKGSQIVISAISTNLPKMVQALLLGLLFMYAWMILGMVLLRDAHTVDTCSNMFQCFFAVSKVFVMCLAKHFAWNHRSKIRKSVLR